MRASIHPLGERARHNRWIVTATAYVTGSVSGAALLGGALGSLGLLAPALPHRTMVLAALCLGAAAADAGAVALPTVRRQVNEDWMHRYRGWVYGLGFGFQLGLGVVTVVTTAAIYLWMAAAVLSGSVASGMAMGTTFGLLRALPVLSEARVDGPARLRRAHQRFQRWGRTSRPVTAAGMVVAGLAAVGGGLRWPA